MGTVLPQWPTWASCSEDADDVSCDFVVVNGVVFLAPPMITDSEFVRHGD